ncbi:unnamed protein product [Protopolystoma xenopodis]|uniref:Uncharacterized protein n=1 Tax=Protopolystoma xenopodis TaxID=117903 RepID=A0A448WNV8_9PLAT|nr:unnamed protein product [Protopolystoma xenopodis]
MCLFRAAKLSNSAGTALDVFVLSGCAFLMAGLLHLCLFVPNECLISSGEDGGNLEPSFTTDNLAKGGLCWTPSRRHKLGDTGREREKDEWDGGYT